MNQQHGIEIDKLIGVIHINGLVEVCESIIEDNFSDGIHMTYPQSRKSV